MSSARNSSAIASLPHVAVACAADMLRAVSFMRAVLLACRTACGAAPCRQPPGTVAQARARGNAGEGGYYMASRLPQARDAKRDQVRASVTKGSERRAPAPVRGQRES